MELASIDSNGASSCLSLVKQLSGRRVELERRRRGLSQVALGRKAGLGPAWIRQLEGGYPKVRLDDHLACLEILGVSPLTAIVPMLFILHGRPVPPHLLYGDLHRLEMALMEHIVEWNVADLRDTCLRPRN